MLCALSLWPPGGGGNGHGAPGRNSVGGGFDGRHLVGGGAVAAGNGDAEQAEIDAELGAVVDHMVHGPFAVDGLTGVIDDGLAVPLHGPAFRHFGIGGGGKGGAGFGEVGVEAGEHPDAGFALPVHHFGGGFRGENEFGLGEGDEAPFGEIGDVPGEAAEFHGFVVGLPEEMVVRDQSQEFTGDGEFLVESRKDMGGKRHEDVLLRGAAGMGGCRRERHGAEYIAIREGRNGASRGARRPSKRHIPLYASGLNRPCSAEPTGP